MIRTSDLAGNTLGITLVGHAQRMETNHTCSIPFVHNVHGVLLAEHVLVSIMLVNNGGKALDDVLRGVLHQLDQTGIDSIQREP